MPKKVTKLPSTSLILIMFLIPSIILNIFMFLKIGESGNKNNTGEYAILAVLDGDTIVLENKVRLRLRNLDAPELENCGGSQAKALLERLVGKNNVDIRERIIDQKGRPMALIYVGNTLLNAELLKSGWVRYHHDTNPQSGELKKLADLVKAQDLGVWSECIHTKPPNPKCNIKGNFADGKVSKKIYFIPGCVHYSTTAVEQDKGEQWFCSEEQAKAAGFIKSTRCP
jgi:micrococcal nuclease